MAMQARKSFADYKTDRYIWITTAETLYHPDYLQEACNLYKPSQEMFGQLVQSSASSEILLANILQIPDKAMRGQLLRIFRRYVSPKTQVELIKIKKNLTDVIAHFGEKFRPIQLVQKAFISRPLPDEALAAIFWEGKDRGKRGYDLSEQFFMLFDMQYPDLSIRGPRRGGPDPRLGSILPGYPSPKQPVDFIIYKSTGVITPDSIIAIGLIRYDSDRGGTQEDDRPKGYRNVADEILTYAQANNLSIKVVFVNDGPGLLSGSMWDDYAHLEQSWPGKIMVLTLRMFPERFTSDWLLS